MRNEFVSRLIEHAKKDLRIVLITADLGYSVLEPFEREFPDRFFNMGISEQAIASVAAGMAKSGLKPFVYSIGNFPTWRCAEQLRNDIDYHNLDVTIVTVGGGLAYGNLGYSHHSIQDYGLIRMLPNFTIMSPLDPVSTSFCLDWSLNTTGPKYFRLRKAGEENLFSQFDLAKVPLINLFKGNSNSDNVILTTGAIAQYFIHTKMFKDLGLDSIYHCPIWGMGHKDKFEEFVANKKKITVVEDHILDGGFGSFLLESVSPKLRDRIEILPIKEHTIGRVGSESYLLSLSFDI